MTGFWRRERMAPTWDEGGMLLARVLLGLTAAAVAGVGAFALLFVGTVVATGCFFDCSSDPQPLWGTLLLTGSTVAAGTALAAIWFAVADRAWPVVWKVLGVLVGLAAVGLALTFLAS